MDNIIPISTKAITIHIIACGHVDILNALHCNLLASHFYRRMHDAGWFDYLARCDAHALFYDGSPGHEMHRQFQETVTELSRQE
jgi:hypothetical protein